MVSTWRTSWQPPGPDDVWVKQVSSAGAAGLTIFSLVGLPPIFAPRAA